MGANANLFNNLNLDPVTYGLTTKAQCREKILQLQIQIAKLKEDLATGWRNKDYCKSCIASRKTEIAKIKALQFWVIWSILQCGRHVYL